MRPVSINFFFSLTPVSSRTLPPQKEQLRHVIRQQSRDILEYRILHKEIELEISKIANTN